MKDKRIKKRLSLYEAGDTGSALAKKSIESETDTADEARCLNRLSQSEAGATFRLEFLRRGAGCENAIRA